MSDVQVYTTNYCAYCTRAKALLQKRGIAFEEIDVSRDDEKRAWLVKTTGQRSVPQIFIKGEPIGGSSGRALRPRPKRRARAQAR